MTLKNRLYYGDNLQILRDHIKDETIDLIYLDPPFNSNANYNVIFKEHGGEQSAAQITAFEDTWHWTDESEDIYHYIIKNAPENLSKLMQAYRSFLGENDMMAYLTMMSPRIMELHRVLKPTGSIYLHCDQTASHYLKIILDGVFSERNFLNEIIWAYGGPSPVKTAYPRKHDTIFLYSKTDKHNFNPQYGELPQYLFDRAKKDEDGRLWVDQNLGELKTEKIQELKKEGRTFETKTGGLRRKQFLDEMLGGQLSDVWNIPIINSQSKERLGYPTQKPESLLERVINASSNKGDVILDPFCGCGTTINVAERLGRKWIGIDITHLAVSLMKTRLKDTFDKDLTPYEVIGEPTDLSGAEDLALLDRYQFQWWAVGLIGGRPAQDKKKGKDFGIDGNLYFFDDNTNKAKRIIISVKSGNIKSGDVRDLKGVLEREKAEIGAFITLKPPTKDMTKEALSSGYYESQHFGKFPKIQILTIEELLKGEKLKYPAGTSQTFKKATRQSKDELKQTELF